MADASPSRRLHAACACGTAEEVKSLLEQLTREESGEEDVVNAPNNLGTTPLHAACQRALHDDVCHIIRALVDAGACIDAVARDDSTPLHLACARGNAAAVEVLVECGADIDAVDKSKRSVLHAAAKQGSVEIIERLVQRGANVHAVDKFGRSILHVSVQRKSVEATSLLLSAGVDITATDSDGWSLLHVAVMAGSRDLIELLTKEGADLNVVDQNGKSPLYLAVLNGASASVIQWLVQHGADVNTADTEGKTVFQYVVEHGDVDTMELLADHGARVTDVGEGGRSILYAAVERGRVDALRFLIGKGVDVNAVDENGTSILHVAVAQGKREVVRFLIDRGVDVGATDKDGRTLLHVAVESLPKTGDSEFLIGLLIQGGVPVNAVDARGRTPLHTACYLDRFHDAVAYLLESGAVDALTVEDEDGFCPLHIAAQNLNLKLVEMILNAGAEVNAHCRGGETPLGIAFFVYNTNCEHAYPVARALCLRSAEWDATCDERLAQGRTRAKDALDESKEKDSEEAQEELRKELRQELIWRLGLRECVFYWMEERRAVAPGLTNVPIEVVEQGQESVRTYLDNVKMTSPDDMVYRRKICVVGPAEWGKTSLVKSLKTKEPCLMHKDDRTMGIDLMEWSFEHTSSVEQDGDDETEYATTTTKRHEVTFWDFAGQDVYQVAHSLFYSKRTLYLICVDLEAYAQILESAASSSLRESQLAISRFVRRHIFRWIRSIFARQPDAEFVVIGTKSDQVKDAAVAVSIWRDLRMHLRDWQKQFIEELESEYRVAHASLSSASSSKSYAFLRAGKNDVLAQLDALKAKVIHTVSDEWLIVSNAERSSILSAREALEMHISQSARCFEMPQTYSRVLAVIKTLCREATAMRDPKDRVENLVLPYKALLRVLLRRVEDLKEQDCASILRTLHELGDILWYEREGAGALKDTVILDPKLVLDIVREVINHKRGTDAVALRKDQEAGRVTHDTLSSFPLWCDMDEELRHAFKLLLQYFQLAYPADSKEMDWDSDLIVPTYWKQQPDETGDAPEAVSDFLQRYGYDDTGAHRVVCWEYELSSDLSETIFEHFAVQSYSALFERTIHANCIESFVKGEFASRIQLQQDERGVRDVIRIQVVAPRVVGAVGEEDDERSWFCLRYFVMTMEKVLEAYTGLTASRYIVDLSPNGAQTRHRVNTAVKTLEDAVGMGRDLASVRSTMPWLPRDLNWYIEKAWRRPGVLQDLRTRSLLREMHDKMDVLKKLVVASDSQRQYPALWTLEVKPGTNLAVLRILSDLSGSCFHTPIEFTIPSWFLAHYGAYLKTGISICSNVAPNVLSLGILEKVMKGASEALSKQVDHAKAVHNLIDKLDFSSAGVFDSSATEQLTPRGTTGLLRDLLKLAAGDADVLSIPDLAKLQCAATRSGHYVWANRQEIMAMGEQLTPCDPEFRTKEKSLQSLLGSSGPNAPASNGSLVSPSGKPGKSANGPTPLKTLRLTVEDAVGLAAWDWRRTYCQWRLFHRQAKPLASGITSQHVDESSSPSWRDLSFSIPSADVTSVQMLRECLLEVEIKRPSRLLGMVKVIGKGSAVLGSFVEETTDGQQFECDAIEIPLLGGNQRKVVCRLLSS